MPNHCSQGVYLHGPRTVVEQLFDQLKSNGRFCDVVSPMPFEMWVADDVVDTRYGLSSSPAWYQWRLDHWDTKWDVCDVEITQEIEHSGDMFDKDAKSWFSFSCWTAWGPPMAVWDKLHGMGVEVQADYEDEGMMFAGEYHHGEKREWEPEMEEDEAC